MDYEIIDSDDIYVAHDEIRENKYVLNINIDSLLSNDTETYRMYKSIVNGMSISPFDYSETYDSDDLVWFRDPSDCKLYLLRSLTNENTSVPVYNLGKFDDSGWHNEFEMLNILDYGLSSIVNSDLKNRVVKHQKEQRYHRFGKLDFHNTSSSDYLTNKILRRTLTNINTNRSNVRFPNITRYVDKDNTTINGFYRRYDCGVIEYDILFRFGYDGQKDVDNYGNKTILECNNFKLNQPYVTGELSNIIVTGDSSQYFYGTAQDIFYHINSEYDSVSEIGSLVQKNRNDYVNAYVATLNFPIPFSDTKYNLYCNGMTSQTTNGTNITISPNVITFCDKTTVSVKAILITYPDDKSLTGLGKNAQNGGLISNSFMCKAIGKCARS